MTPRAALLTAALLLACPSSCLAQELLLDVRFHGNHSISDEELMELADLSVGERLDNFDPDEIRERLMQTGRFESVEVQKRYRSMSRTDQVILLISVKEKTPASKKFMFFPVLDYTDEYGFTFGGRVTAIDLLNVGDRISFPLTWGGVRQAAVEPQIPLPSTIFDYASGSFGISQRENPHFDTDDRRVALKGGVRKQIGIFSFNIDGGWTDVHFGTTDDQFVTIGAGAVIDTRTNVFIPRNAVYAGAGWERTKITGGAGFNQFNVDLRGFKSFIGQSVLAAQVYYLGADGPLPDYQQPFLGGSATLRGYTAGQFAGDNLLIGSLELRMPITPANSIARAGFNVFFDTGTVYDHGTSVKDSRFHNGVGGGFFVFAFGLGFKFEVGYDLDNSVRAHFATQFRF